MINDDSPYEIFYLYNNKLHKYFIDKNDKTRSEIEAIKIGFDNFIIDCALTNYNNFETLCFIKNCFRERIFVSPYICKKINGKFKNLNLLEQCLKNSRKYTIKNSLIILESAYDVEIPENINTLIIINPIFHYENNKYLLDNLPNNIEYIYYLGESNIKNIYGLGNNNLIENANNLPKSLKKLYVRNYVNIDNIKLPFGCSIEIFENL